MIEKILEINGDTLTIPELKDYKGKKVKLTIEDVPQESNNGTNLGEFFGILKSNGDGMEFQKKM